MGAMGGGDGAPQTPPLPLRLCDIDALLTTRPPAHPLQVGAGDGPPDRSTVAASWQQHRQAAPASSHRNKSVHLGLEVGASDGHLLIENIAAEPVGSKGGGREEQVQVDVEVGSSSNQRRKWFSHCLHQNLNRPLAIH